MIAKHSIAAAIPLLLGLWTLASLITILVMGLAIRRRARKLLGEKGNLTPLPKSAATRAEIPLLKRAR